MLTNNPKTNINIFKIFLIYNAFIILFEMLKIIYLEEELINVSIIIV